LPEEIKKMKKLLFTMLFPAAFMNAAHAQQLANTYWAAYDQASIFSLFWRFDNTFVSYSTDDVIYTPVSSYSENGNVFDIVDLDSVNCAFSDTGHYNFILEDDTLIFTLLSETCITRSDYMLYHYFVRIHAGIENVKPVSQVEVYPNPFCNELTVKGSNEIMQLALYDISGRVLLYESFSESIKVNTENLERGIYFYEVRHKNGVIKKGKIEKS
jgi:hypothetical protein